MGLLLEKGQFVIAKKYAIIVKSTASQITIKEASYVHTVVCIKRIEIVELHIGIHSLQISEVFTILYSNICEGELQ